MQTQTEVIGHGGPQSTVIQTVAPGGIQPQQPSTGPFVLPRRNLHMIFGIIQMSVGGLCFLLEVFAVCFITTYIRFGTGIYCGIFFFVPGLLGLLAGKLNSTCCIVGCMVMNIIGACVAVIGISFASIEIGYFCHVDFRCGKSAFVLCACLFEFIFTIVHASFACSSYCHCCMPRVPVTDANEVTTTSIQHHNQYVQQQTHQQYAYQYPQQWQPIQFYPFAAGQNYYPPQQPVMQPNFPQTTATLANNPSFDPAVSHADASLRYTDTMAADSTVKK